MRRTRDTPTAASESASSSHGTNGTTPPSGFDLYTLNGDATGALREVSTKNSSSSAAGRYNQALLQMMVARGFGTAAEEEKVTEKPADGVSLTKEVSVENARGSSISSSSHSVNDFLALLNPLEDAAIAQSSEELDRPHSVSSSSSHKRRRSSYIASYNRALVWHTAGDIHKASEIVKSQILPFLEEQKTKKAEADASSSSSSSKSGEHDDIVLIASRMALLLLECHLTMRAGRHNAGTSSTISSTVKSNDCAGPGIDGSMDAAAAAAAVQIPKILEWLDGCDSEKDPHLKFLLPVYKSRLSLAELDKNYMRTDTHIRSARKDLKTAMEVFSNKLRPSATNSSGEVASVVSSTNGSEEGTSLAGHGRGSVGFEQQMPSSIVLQKMNRSALCLKAHMEQLKGNTKKSLILCSEAMSATNSAAQSNAPFVSEKDNDMNGQDDYQHLHENNLAIVYETKNRRNLALFALLKARMAAKQNYGTKLCVSQLFCSDGTARPDVSLSILHNTALCALRARQYSLAYECMATCLDESPTIFGQRPLCWLRLAEACLGLYTIVQRNGTHRSFQVVEDIKGEPQGIVLERSLFNDDIGIVQREQVASKLASVHDLEQVQRNPLLRARVSLEHILSMESQIDVNVVLSARLSLCYVYLAFGEFQSALTLATQVLEDKLLLLADTTTEGSDAVRRLRKRQTANARMYAAEASCALGKMTDAMKLLVGDGKEDAFDRLASDLSGVTFETASTNTKGKRRLAKAQTVVRSSACAVTAAMGNPAAKQLANSANAMEDRNLVNGDRSCARRALIYTLLQEGNSSSALTMLLALR